MGDCVPFKPGFFHLLERVTFPTSPSSFTCKVRANDSTPSSAGCSEDPALGKWQFCEDCQLHTSLYMLTIYLLLPNLCSLQQHGHTQTVPMTVVISSLSGSFTEHHSLWVSVPSHNKDAEAEKFTNQSKNILAHLDHHCPLRGIPPQFPRGVPPPCQQTAPHTEQCCLSHRF